MRSVVLPRDHGSWSFVLEPVCLGLLAAPSWSGTAIGVAALAAFLTRRPLQVARANDGRRGMALVVVACLGAVSVSALAAGLDRAAGPAWAPLLVALPCAAAFAWFDRQKAAREAAAELSGACAFATVAAVIALAAGRPPGVAALLGGFAVARVVVSIVPIRTFLRRRKGQPVVMWPSILATLAGLAAFVGVGIATGTWLPAAWMVLFALRAAWLLGPRPPAWPAARVGAIETILGAAAVLTVGLSSR